MTYDELPNSSQAPDHTWRHVQSLGYSERMALAASPELRCDMWLALTNDEHVHVRVAAASNVASNDYDASRAIRTTLVLLVTDDIFVVRAAALRHLQIPADTQYQLVREDMHTILEAMASNLFLDGAVREALARHDHPKVRASFAANPTIDRALLALLADDPQFDVRKAAWLNPRRDPSLANEEFDHLTPSGEGL